VAPLAVSNVWNENSKSHGGRGLAVDAVNVTAPRISARVPVPPELANGRRATEICPDVTVKGAALPMVAPAAFRNRIVPVQDAAVPLEEFDAAFTTLISAVSVAPRPAGGNVNSRLVGVVVVCAKAVDTAAAPSIKIKLRIIFPLCGDLFCET